MLAYEMEAKSITKNGIRDIEQLKSTQEEADTRIILHVNHIRQPNVITWSPDTDVLVLLIYYFKQLSSCRKLFMKTGVKDKTRFIPIHDICNSMDDQVCRLLLPIHSLTGCDSTSAVARIGKVKPWNLLVKSPAKFIGLNALGLNVETSEDLIECCSSFFSALYGGDPSIHIDKMRYKLFSQRQYQNEYLPPTRDSLCHHIQRANFQAYIWRSALTAKPDIPSPVNHGWEIQEPGILTPVLTSLPPAPESLVELTVCKCKGKACSRCACFKAGLACTEACACSAEEDCANTFNSSCDIIDDEYSSESDSESSDSEDE